MDISAVPRKCINLSSLPIKDAKIRRLFIFSDGKRSLEEIFKLSAIAEKNGLELIQQLLESDILALKVVGFR